MRPRIALFCQSLTGTGGTERVIATLSQLLSSRYDVFEVSFDPPSSRRHFESPAKFFPLGPSIQMPLPLRPITYIRDAYRLWRFKRRSGIQLTISNLWRADLLSILSLGSDRKISICHINIVGNARNRLLFRLRGLASRIYRRFDRIVSVSSPLADEIRRLFALAPSQCRVIHNCVLARPATPESNTIEREKIRIVWCGRMVEEKNVLALVPIFAEAHAKNPDLQLILIGDGALRSEVLDSLEQHGLRVSADFENHDCDVVLTGFVDDPVQLVARCDFQVLTSIAEGLGMVLIEGFSVGVPALASDCSGGGVHDAMGGHFPFQAGRIHAEKTDGGFLLPVPDRSGSEARAVWVNTVLQLAGDWALRKQLSESARERALLFSPEVIAPRWFRLLDEILES